MFSKRRALLYSIVLLAIFVALASKLNVASKLKYWMTEQEKDYADYMIYHHMLMDGSVPNGAVIFLGDSTIHGLLTSAIISNSVNYGIGGLDTAQLLSNIPSYKSLNHASKIVLDIGVNDFFQGQKAGLNDRLKEILKALPEDTHLIWNSLMPSGMAGVKMQEIKDTNDVIKALCLSRNNCTYINTWDLFTDARGHQDDALFLDDKLHLNTAGYRIWIDALKSALNSSTGWEKVKDEV
ncbi:MAG: SGNH/GDSL hydrolase family protein [Methylophilaceae bacterium]